MRTKRMESTVMKRMESTVIKGKAKAKEKGLERRKLLRSQFTAPRNRRMCKSMKAKQQRRRKLSTLLIRFPSRSETHSTMIKRCGCLVDQSGTLSLDTCRE